MEIIRIKLSATEQILIRKIAEIQLENLHNIHQGKCHRDLDLVRAQEGIDKDTFDILIETQIDFFEELEESPEDLFLILPPRQLETLVFIMQEFMEGDEYVKARFAIYQKIRLYHSLNKIQNFN